VTTALEDDLWRLPDPRFADLTWIRDGVHVPRPLAPLVGDAVEYWYSRVAGRPIAVLNGFAFMSMGRESSPVTYELAPQEDPSAAWFDFYVPRIEAIIRWATVRDWDAMPLDEAADALPPMLDALSSAFSSTMAPLGPLGAPLNELIAFCRAYLGEGEANASALILGHQNATSAIGTGIAGLAARAKEHARLAAAVRSRDLDAIAAAPGGIAWLQALDAFLADFGRGNQTWFDFMPPTWSEDPAVPLALIGRAMDGDMAESASGEARREAAVVAARAQLPGDAEQRQLGDLLERTRDYIAIVEDRARLQLVLAAAPRPAVLAIGRKLASMGVLEQPEDVFFLHLGELSAAPHDSREAVQVRRDAWRGWHEIAVPESIGAPMPPGLGRIAGLRQQFGVGAPEDMGDGVIRGHGASPGTITGTARVIHSLDDGARLEPGDILVCHNTAPPWTPLLGIAAALVTESGGNLSHAAIAAREYGIPAVVGARNVMRRVPDGATVTVDGSAGTVVVQPE
jgi:phosphohistidine swiveling domain-containing protein